MRLQSAIRCKRHGTTLAMKQGGGWCQCKDGECIMDDNDAWGSNPQHHKRHPDENFDE